MLEQRAAQALHDGADALAVQRQRIDDAADVLDRNIVEQLDLSGLGIDRDMGGMRAVGIGSFVAGVRAFGGYAGKFLQVDGAASGPTAMPRSIAISPDRAIEPLRRGRANSSRRRFAALTIALPPITIERDENEPKPSAR